MTPWKADPKADSPSKAYANDRNLRPAGVWNHDWNVAHAEEAPVTTASPK